jgi:hypothetical protein
MKSRGNELEVSGGTVGSGGAATAVLSTGAQVVGKERKKGNGGTRNRVERREEKRKDWVGEKEGGGRERVKHESRCR